jgi:hypothetical protein
MLFLYNTHKYYYVTFMFVVVDPLFSDVEKVYRMVDSP